MKKEVIRQVILRCINPDRGQNKFYELTIVYTNDEYVVNARWGRISQFESGNTQSDIKHAAGDYADANAALERIVNQKKKKGYKVYMDVEPINGDVVKNLPKSKNVVEKKEVILEWWQHPNMDLTEREV